MNENERLKNERQNERLKNENERPYLCSVNESLRTRAEREA